MHNEGVVPTKKKNARIPLLEFVLCFTHLVSRGGTVSHSLLDGGSPNKTPHQGDLDKK